MSLQRDLAARPESNWIAGCDTRPREFNHIIRELEDDWVIRQPCNLRVSVNSALRIVARLATGRRKPTKTVGAGSILEVRGFPHCGKYYVNDQAGDPLHHRRRRKLHDCLFMGNRLGVSQKFFVGPWLSILPASNFPLRNPLPSRPAIPSCLQALGCRSGSLGCRGASLLAPCRR